MKAYKLDDLNDDNNLGIMEEEKDTAFDEDSPIFLEQNQDENPLISYVYDYIIKGQSIKENACAARVRFGIKILSLLYGATAGLPYISASCDAGQGNMFLCISFATGNVIAYGGATAWAGLRLTESLDPISNEEKEILHSRPSCCVIKHLACNALGILASIPGAYSVYKYNNDKFKFLAIPGFLTSYIFSTVGYYEVTNPDSMFQQLLSKFQKKDTTVKTSNEIKEKLINHVKYHAIPEILEDDEHRDYLFTEDTLNVSKAKSVRGFIDSLFLLNCPSNSTEPPESWMGGYPRRIAQTISIILPLGNATVNYLLTYEVANLLTESAIFSSSFAISTVIPSFMLDVLATTTTVGNVFDVSSNMLRKRNIANFTATFYPKINFVIPVISVGLAGLSVAGDWFVAHDTIQKSKLNSLVDILPWMVFMSNTIFESFGMRDLLHDAINYCSMFRKDTIGETANKVNRLEKFTSIISNCVPSVLYNFWKNLANT